MLRNSSTLIRWLCIYIPIIILLSALMLEKAAIFSRFRSQLTALCIITLVIIVATADKSFYYNHTYSSQHILKGYLEARQSGKPPVISNLYAFTDKEGRVQMAVFRDDTLMKGASQLFCYYPIFGYNLEQMPFGSLHLGPVDETRDGRFNIKNPACYVYPEENNCAVGDQFTSSQSNEVKAFVSYQPYPFEVSVAQKMAGIIAIIAFATLGVFWLGYCLLAIKKR